MKKYENRGFIALFSVIIITLILILITLTLSFSNISTRFNIFNYESKKESEFLAEACIEKARLSIATDNYIFEDNIILTIEDNACNYMIYNTSPLLTIISHSTVNKANTYLQVLVDENSYNISVISFSEIPTYP